MTDPAKDWKCVMSATENPRGFSLLSAEICADPEVAWAVFCNIAVPLRDATGLARQPANEAAAHLMQHLFGCDITTHEHYEYGKSGAQSFAEFRIAMDDAEDALLAGRAK